MPRRSTRPLAPVPRYTLTRREAAASLGVSINHFERRVQPELKVVLSGQLILIPVAELELGPAPRAPTDAGSRHGRRRQRWLTTADVVLPGWLGR